MIDNNLYEARLPLFNRALDEDYPLLGLRIEAALESRQLAGTSTNEDVDEETSRRAMAIRIAALTDNPLREIQNCTSAKQAWKKLKTQYASS